MNRLITRFVITELFGYRDVDLDFSKPYKILIGENGLGKTTVLNCLYYTLSQKFKELEKIKFSGISVFFGEDVVSFTRHQVICYNQKDFAANASSFYRLLENNLQDTDLREIDKIIFKKSISVEEMRIIRKMLVNRGIGATASDLFVLKNLKKVVSDYVAMKFMRQIELIEKYQNLEILYFPTYRRIESSFNIESTIDEMRQNNPFFDEADAQRMYHTEMIKYGMSDVKERIATITSEISQQTREGFSSVLGDMLSVLARNNTKFEKRQKFEEDKINIVLSRLSNAINDEDKKRILEYALSDGQKESKYLDFLISRLIALYEDHRDQDDAIKKFVETCNYYLFDKKFVYRESEIDLYLESFHDKERLDLDCLSSGEKQIVSLFSKIFLEVDKIFLIIFDEPELSLSMRWQQRLLPDIVNSEKCNFLVAATHAPFIFDNELRPYAVALSDSMRW